MTLMESLWKRLRTPGLIIGIMVMGLSGCSLFPHSDTSSQVSKMRFSDSGCKSGHYRVKKGDSVFRIAKKCGINPLALVDANALLPPFVLHIGQQLKIPKTEYGAKRQFNRKVSRPKRLWQLPVSQQSAIESLKIKNKRLFIYPKKPTFLYAVAPGTVAYMGKSIPTQGLMVIVKHPDGYLSVYTRLATSFVKKGQKVSTSTKLGVVVPTLNSEKAPYVEARYLGRRVSIYPLFSEKIRAIITSRSSVVNTL
ncbi:LysM peptidoglycan-binding domain-containing protein [Galenea microaerophila]